MMLEGSSSDASTEILERQWFAAYKAASAMRTQCEALLDVMASAEKDWNRARLRLSDLETLRDALGEELAARDARGDLDALDKSLREGRELSAA